MAAGGRHCIIGRAVSRLNCLFWWPYKTKVSLFHPPKIHPLWDNEMRIKLGDRALAPFRIAFIAQLQINQSGRSLLKMTTRRRSKRSRRWDSATVLHDLLHHKHSLNKITIRLIEYSCSLTIIDRNALQNNTFPVNCCWQKEGPWIDSEWMLGAEICSC